MEVWGRITSFTGGVLCTVGCLAVSLASAHQMPQHVLPMCDKHRCLDILPNVPQGGGREGKRVPSHEPPVLGGRSHRGLNQMPSQRVQQPCSKLSCVLGLLPARRCCLCPGSGPQLPVSKPTWLRLCIPARLTSAVVSEAAPGALPGDALQPGHLWP